MYELNNIDIYFKMTFINWKKWERRERTSTVDGRNKVDGGSLYTEYLEFEVESIKT